jgi:hypothetical protein
MLTKLDELLDEIHSLQERVTEEIGREAEEFGYSLRQGRVSFEREVVRRHRQMATRLHSYLAQSSLLTLVTAPVIYSLILPLVLIDLFAWTYQRICFPVYGIPRVRRADYVVLDRQRLQYLNIVERMNCMYCGYGNGVLAYAVEVAARTEQYWCPIKHASRVPSPHSRYHRFLPYGDAEGYVSELERLREELRDLGKEGAGK